MNNNKYCSIICLVYTIFLGIFSLPVIADTESATTLGSISLGKRTMDFSIRDRQFDAQFTTVELALSRSFKPFFISLNIESSINTAVENNGSGLIFYDRQDASITMGGRVLSFMTLFGGFRQGITDSQYYDGIASEGSVKSRGPFAGVSFDYIVGNAGVFSASVAIAQLGGEVPFNEPFVSRPTGVDAPDVVEGSALGFSYGLRWTAALTRETSYNVQLRLHRYTFIDQVVYGGVDLSYDENFTSLSMGLTHNF